MKQARQRRTPLPTADERFVTEAFGAVLGSSGQLARYEVRWIAYLAGQPTDQYRRFARKLLELEENA